MGVSRSPCCCYIRKKDRMSRSLVLALVVAMAAIASAQFGNNPFGYLGYGYGGNYGFNNFNQNWYPNIQPGFGFYNQQPYGGFGGCQYWCRSQYNAQYYCCTNAGNVFGFNYGR